MEAVDLTNLYLNFYDVQGSLQLIKERSLNVYCYLLKRKSLHSKTRYNYP